MVKFLRGFDDPFLGFGVVVHGADRLMIEAGGCGHGAGRCFDGAIAALEKAMVYGVGQGYEAVGVDVSMRYPHNVDVLAFTAFDWLVRSRHGP